MIANDQNSGLITHEDEVNKPFVVTNNRLQSNRPKSKQMTNVGQVDDHELSEIENSLKDGGSKLAGSSGPAVQRQPRIGSIIINSTDSRQDLVKLNLESSQHKPFSSLESQRKAEVLLVGEENYKNNEINAGGVFNHSESNRNNKKASQKKFKQANDSLEFEAIEDESQNDKSQNDKKSKDNQPQHKESVQSNSESRKSGSEHQSSTKKLKRIVTKTIINKNQLKKIQQDADDQKRNSFKARAERFLGGWVFQGFMAFITIYSLFGDDIRSVLFDASDDYIFYIMTSISFGFFIVEMILQSLLREDYWLSFYFWLDLISTLSLLTDIGWFMDALTDTGSSNTQGNGSNIQQATKLARASRGARIGTRAARFARVIRIIRMLRIMKLYKSANFALNQLEVDQLAAKKGQVVPVSVNVLPPTEEQTEQQSPEKNNIPANFENSAQISQEGSQNNQEDNNQAVILDVQEDIHNFDTKGNDDQNYADLKMKEKDLTHTGKNSLHNNFTAVIQPQLNPRRRSAGEQELVQKNNAISKRVNIKSSHSQDISENEGSSINIQEKLHPKEKPENEQIMQESKVGKQLSDLTVRRVIILVLAMLISVPIFSDTTFEDDNTSFKIGISMIKNYEPHSYQFNRLLKSIIETESQSPSPLIYLDINDVIWELNGIQLDNIRDADQQVIIAGDNYEFLAIYDLRYTNKIQGIMSIANTIFVMIILTGGTLLFSMHCTELVITPIEQMVQKVSRIADNPLVAAQEEENEALLIENLHETTKPRNFFTKLFARDENQILETEVLEKTIVKIGALLALGYGEAGSQIIAKNIKSSGGVNPIIAGHKIMGIFGFCDIRNFTDATEVLQEEVMIFVNQIGEIVHNVVDQFSGAPNKNIGDAFLVVWKFQDKDYAKDEQGSLVLKNTNPVNQLADMAFISFLKIISHIKKSRKLLKYKENKALNERIPNYQIKMGFGLHVGWAIEGAIGSFYKIDASYLSPHVNMASRLEAATKQFGVPILISGQLQRLFSHQVQSHTRQIDRVTVKGSVEPLDLYTCDVDTSQLPFEIPEPKLNGKQQKLKRAKLRIARDRFRDMCFNDQLQACMRFEIDNDFLLMRKPFSHRFYEVFQDGFQDYIFGAWEQSRDKLLHVEVVKGCPDYPTRQLLTIMSETDFIAPHNWEGYRELTEK